MVTCFKLLLEHPRIDVNLKNDMGLNILMYTLNSGVEMLSILLLKKGVIYSREEVMEIPGNFNVKRFIEKNEDVSAGVGEDKGGKGWGLFGR